MNESNIDRASAPKRARQTRSFVERRKSPIPSTSSLIPRTKKDVEKSAKGEKKSECNGTRNQKSASTTSNKKNNYKSKPSKSQKSTPKASAKKKSKPKCLKSTSAIAKDRMKSIKWKRGSLFYDVPFTKQIVYSDDLSSLRTPYEFFRYFFTNSLSQHICEQSVLYSIQNDPTKSLQMSTEDLDKFLGVLILHSVAPCKNFRMRWNPNVGNPVIRETITINRFEKLRQFLHFADNSQMKDRTDADFDKLFKLRPFIDAIRERFLSVPMEEHLSLEQMCLTKARHHLRQFMPLKPKKHGFKFFVLYGASGFGYDFEMYVGSSNAEVEAECDFGVTLNVVLLLTKPVPPDVGHKIFFDNFYTALPLLVKLQSRGIYALGTVQKK